MGIAMEERNDFFTDFLLTNDGELVFGKFLRQNYNEYITKLSWLSNTRILPVYRLIMWSWMANPG